MTRDCTCDKCVESCHRMPGLMIPGDAERIAKFLNITREQLEEKLIKNYQYDENLLVLQPRKVGSDPDEKIASDHYTNTKGTCVFLKNDRCIINEVKPYECREALLCEKQINAWPVVNAAWTEYYEQKGSKNENTN